MLELAGWLIVAFSFVLIGLFGYLAVGQTSSGFSSSGLRVLLAIIVAAVSAFALNFVAGSIFTTIEIRTFKEFGSIHEDQMQPDMPNLMAGLIMFGWAFFAAGLIVGRLSKRANPNNESEQGADRKPDHGPS